MNYAYIAFFTGIIGSLHCVAMCGPLVAAMPYAGESAWRIFFQILTYQFGRIFVYGLLGTGVGFIGSGFGFIGLQQILSALTGILLLSIGISHFLPVKTAKRNVISIKFNTSIVRLLGKYINKPMGGFLAGALNGLLPCGILYIALGQAVNLASVIEAAQFMVVFGLGTTPLLLVTAIFPVIFRKTRLYLGFLPALFILSGSILLARGLNIPIPHVSHQIQSNDGILECR